MGLVRLVTTIVLYRSSIKVIRRFLGMSKPDHTVIDCHTHLFSIADICGFLEIMDATGLSAINLLALVNPMPPWYAKPNTPEWNLRWFPRDVSVNVASMFFKVRYPGRVYVFGGLDHDTPEERAGRPDFLGQAQTLIKMGVDGFKMWEGGYFLRETTGLALDAPEYDAYYALLESQGLPILYHVSQDYRPEIDRMLVKHPHLKVIFAHFYGGSRDMVRLRRFFDTWPNTYVDLAPGMILRGLSENCHEAHQFFTEYADRILFGTDASATSPQSVDRGKLLVRFIRRLLERADNLDLAEIGVTQPVDDPSLNPSQRQSRWEFWADHGLYLTDDVLARIYSGNFVRIVGPKPRPAHPGVVLEQCQRLMTRVSQNSQSLGVEQELQQIVASLQAMA
jgi:hypothetical protein